MSTQGEHTPGPWYVQERADAYTHIVRTGENRFLCQLAQDITGESRANARLIAAAPELLQVLIDLHGDCIAADTYMRAAEFMIAKATGRTENERDDPKVESVTRQQLEK